MQLESGPHVAQKAVAAAPHTASQANRSADSGDQTTVMPWFLSGSERMRLKFL